MKTLHYAKEARHKRSHIVRFLLYDMSKEYKSLETEHSLVVARGWGEERREWGETAYEVWGFILE